MELRAFIDFMRKRSRSGGPKTISLDGKFYASFPSINQISEGLFQTLVHSTNVVAQWVKRSRLPQGKPEPFEQEGNQLVVWSQTFSITRSTKSMENTDTCLQEYCRAMQAGSHHLNCSRTLLESLLATNSSQEPGRYHAYLSKIPAQCTLQADTCKNYFRNPHSLSLIF